jgi:hypothetical protein
MFETLAKREYGVTLTPNEHAEEQFKHQYSICPRKIGCVTLFPATKTFKLYAEMWDKGEVGYGGVSN